MNMLNKGVLTREFARKWGKREQDQVLAEHFLFNADFNDRFRAAARQFIDFVSEDVEEASEKESSESDSKSSSKSEDD